jgi:hypothetical protein
MGMVWIGYEQTEQLRQYGATMRVPIKQIVAEAVGQWLKYIAPARLNAHGLTSLSPPLKATGHSRLYDPEIVMDVSGILEAVEAQLQILQGVKALLQGSLSPARPAPELSPKPARKENERGDEDADRAGAEASVSEDEAGGEVEKPTPADQEQSLP